MVVFFILFLFFYIEYFTLFILLSLYNFLINYLFKKNLFFVVVNSTFYLGVNNKNNIQKFPVTHEGIFLGFLKS